MTEFEAGLRRMLDVSMRASECAVGPLVRARYALRAEVYQEVLDLYHGTPTANQETHIQRATR